MPSDPPPEDEVEVHGHYAIDPATTSASVTVIPLGPLLPPGEDVGSVLEEVAGTRVRRMGGLGSFTALSLRGSSYRQVEYYLDGLPLNPDGGATIDLSELPAAAFSRVEVYRGAGPLGSSAMGGVVNLVTEPMPATFTFGGGSFGTLHSSMTASPKLGPLTLTLVADQLHTNGNWEYFDDQGTEYNLTDDRTLVREHNALDRAGGLIRASIDVGNTRFLLLDTPGFSVQELAGPTAAEIAHATYRSSRNLLALGIDTRRGMTRLQPELWWSWREDVFDDRMGELGVGAQYTRDRTQTLGMQARAGHLWTSPTLVLGQAMLRTRLEQYRPYDQLTAESDGVRSRLGFGAGISSDIQLLQGRLSLSPVIWASLLDNRMLGEVPFENTPVAPQSQDLDLFLAPRLGILFHPLPLLALKGSIGRYNRPPDLYELFGDRGLTVGNTDLLAEEGLSYQGSIRFDHCVERFSLAIEGAWAETYATHLIAYVQNSQLTQRAENVGRAWIRSIELNTALTLGEMFSTTASLTRMQSRNLVTDPVYANNQLPGLAPWEFAWSAELRYQQKLSVSYDFSFIEGSFLDTANVQLTAPRFIHGIGLKVQPDPRLPLLQAQVLNLLDTRGLPVARDPLHPDAGEVMKPMTDFGGYPLPGRTILLSLTWKEQ